MYDGIINQALAIPIRLEDTSEVGVTGKESGDLTVEKADKDDTSWITVIGGNRSLVELGSGDYILIIVASVIDTLGFFRAKVACTGCVTKQYVTNIKLANFSDGAVHADLPNGSAGFTYPIGTRSKPASTVANALDIADTNKLRRVLAAMGASDETITDSGVRLQYKTVEGLHSPFRKDSVIGTLAFSGSPFNLKGSKFKNLRVAPGVGEGQGVEFEDCYIEGGSGLDDYSMKRCVLESSLNVTGFADLLNCHFLGGDIEVQSTTAGDGFSMARCSGKIVIKNMDNANNFINLDGFFGDIEIQSSCTLGTINIRGGGGKLTNNGGGVTVNEDGFITNGAALTAQQTRDAMKLAPSGGAPAAGSVDEHLDDIEDKVVDKAKMKDLIFNRTVLSRHPAGPGEKKPKTIGIGTAGAEGTVTTTLDGENLDTEAIS